MDNDIVISGIAGRYPECENVEEFWYKLINAIPMYTADDRRWPVDLLDLPKYTGKLKDIEKFDASFFNVSDTEANQMDPQMRIFHETTYEAIYDAGIDPAELKNTQTAVYLGSCYNDAANAKFEEITSTTQSLDIGPSEISQRFQFKGLTVLIDTACASSFSALHEAIQSIKMNIIDQAVVGGIALHLKPGLATGFRNLRMLSPDGRCKCLDSKADGYCRSEAVVSMFIQRRSAAKRIYSTILHSKTNSDGYKTEGITFPSRDAQYNLMKACYEEAKIDPEEKINYVEAHITGTPVGDPVESDALVKALRPNRNKPILMGCLKSSIGHSEGGSALCSITKVALALQRRELPPNINYETPNPNIDELKTGIIKPVIERQAFNEDYISLNSFGFGGVNVHAILKANEKVLKPEDFDWTGENGINRLINLSNRTIEGLNYTIDYITENRSKVSRDYLYLLDEQSKISIKNGLNARGFAIFDNEGKLIEKRVNTIDESRPIWFVFNGLGSQWPGMCKRLLVFDVFRQSIERMANVLKKHNIDLIHLLTEAGDDAFEKDLCNVLVCITSTQIALVDFLAWLGVKADGIFGHSVGEYGAAYAAGAATSEQIIELVYHLGRCNNELHKARGAMASVGLNWEDADKLCKQTGDKVFASCDNNDSNVTISGDYEQVQKIVDKLNKDDVFAKNVFCCEMAFHCKIANVAYKETLEEFNKILTNPIKRSDNWISTSVRPEQLNDEKFSHFTGEYCSNNMVAPVYFRETLEKVPKNAVIIEFGPHCQLLPLIRRQLGSNIICVPLTKRNTDNKFDNANTLLSGLGQIYQSGNDLSIDKLYPKVTYPVARETLSLSHLLKWNHEKKYFVAKFPSYFNFLTPTIKFKVDLVDANQKFFSGHVIDGRILFPATGYLISVWNQLARMNKKIDSNELPVEFSNINLQRAVIIPKNGSATLQITLLEQTGDFSISESGSVCCTGRINLIPNNELKFNHNLVKKVTEEDAILLKTKDIYKELRIRGYDYSGGFQGLVEALSDGSVGKVKWTGNWTTFTDCMLQMAVFGNQTSRSLFLPTFIEYVRIDSKYLLSCADEMRKETGKSIFEVTYDKYANIGMTKGVLIKGLKASPAPRSQKNAQSANIEYYEFTPYNQPIPEQIKLTDKNRDYLDLCLNILEEKVDKENLENLVEDREENACAKFLNEKLIAEQKKEDFDLYQELLNRDEELAKDKIIRINFNKVLKNQLSVVIDNHFSRQIKIVEVNCTAGLISQDIEEHMQSYHINTTYSIMQETASSSLQPSFVEKIIEFSSELNTIPSTLDKIQLMIFADWSLSFLCKLETSNFDYKVFLKSGFDLMVPGAFMVFCFRSKYTPIELEIAERIKQFTNVKTDLPQTAQVEELLKSVGFVQIGSTFDDQTNVHSILVRKPIDSELKDEDHYELYVQNLDYSWLDELKRVVKEKKKRVWLIADRQPTSGLIGMATCLKREPNSEGIRCLFNGTNEKIELTNEIKQKDLFFNIYQKDVNNVGSYRYYAMDLEKTKKVEDAYVDVITKGDLSSLRWIELDRNWKDNPNERIIQINYAALNFKDVMVASSRIPLSAYPASKDFCSVGMEFAGVDLTTGKRVFGFTNCGAIGSKVCMQKDSFSVEAPDHWTLAEASTVSVVYVTVYYSLFIRGNLLPGESILIHAGSGGVGQAAISVCLRKGCEVFTTVGSEEKKRFLLERFPLLKEENILNSRTDKFEEEILKATNGQGVNMILNSLAEEKLRASVNCLSDQGRFIEIGKYDMVVNNKMDMSNFIRNKSFSVVCVAHLQDDALNKHTPSAIKIMQRINEMLRLGVQNGEVQPLPYKMFKHNEVEQAFRYMANGKHIGKVLIEVQNENEPLHSYDALPKSYFSSEKSYIITGGLGGFGLELANWLRDKGATKLVLSSRSGIKTPYQELSIQRLRKSGVNILVSTNTCTTYSSAASLLEEANQLGPIGGIFNLAMVLKDAILENQTVESFNLVCEPKVNTTIYLDKLSRKLCPELDYFVCFSSIAAGLGNAGQQVYGFANSVMERIMEQRKDEGLHGLAIQWGSIGDVGIVAEQFGNDVNLGGTIPQRIPFCLEILDKFIISDHAVCSSVVLSAAKKSLGKDKNDLVRVICHVIGVKDISVLDPNTTLLDLGLDSLMAVEIKQGLEREYETVLSTQEIRELTIRDLQEIGARKQAVHITSRKESTDLTTLTIQNMFTKMPTKVFVKLNEIEEKEPIFFIPPIEADFKLMMMLIDQLNRPVIGLNWTEECSKMNSIKEVAIYLAEKLIEEYTVSTYDLVGYSFGSTIAFELSAQLQERLGAQSVRKLIFLDGSPDLLRIQTENLIKKTDTHDEGSAFVSVIITFVSVFHEIEDEELMKEKLLAQPTKREKSEMIADYLSSKLHFKVDAVELEKALDSYMNKLKMLYFYKPSHKFSGAIKLIKASEKGVMWVDQINDADYGINKLITPEGSCEVFQVQGDHRTFIKNNANEIGTLIDSILDYIPL